MSFNFLDIVAAPADSTSVIEQPIEAAKEVASAVQDGRIDEVIKQLVNYCMDAGKSILLAVVIFVVGRFVINFLNRMVARMMEKRHVEPTIKSFVCSAVNILLTVMLLITVISALGINITTFAALLASVGVAAGMALSGNLQNLAGGLIILLLKPYRVGDYVEAQGIQGVVQGIHIFHTMLLTVDNKVIYVPNGALSSGNVTNYSQSDLRRVDLTVGIEYGQDFDHVKSVLNELIAADERILKDPAHNILLCNLGASSVDINIRLWVKGADYWAVFFSMNERIYAEFNRRGIGFPFPQLTIHQSN